MSHPQKPTDTGHNRTGIGTSKANAKQLVEGVERAVPNPVLDPERLRALHEEFANAAPPLGTLPPNGKQARAKQRGNVIAVLLDKLGERIAFERSSVRLYDALLVKLSAASPHDTGIHRKELEEIRDDELLHFGVLCEAARKLGADPTVMTSSADVMGVASSGLLQVLTDSRTTLSQGLEAILVAELADNDGWELLIQLADGFGSDDLSEEFRRCLEEEREHLVKVRSWLQRSVSGQAGLPQPDRPQPPAK
jgi:rubrerythrin